MVEAHEHRADIFIWRGNTPGARQELAEARKLDPDNDDLDSLEQRIDQGETDTDWGLRWRRAVVGAAEAAAGSRLAEAECAAAAAGAAMRTTTPYAHEVAHAKRRHMASHPSACPGRECCRHDSSAAPPAELSPPSEPPRARGRVIAS